MQILLTTNPGIEDLTVEEAERILAPADIVETRWMRGRIIVDSKLDVFTLTRRAGEMHSIHRASIILSRGSICPEEKCLKDLGSAVASSGVEEYITPQTSFAVRAYRYGSHSYTSMDIARIAGDAVIEAVRSRHGFRPPVNLRSPNIIVGVHVVMDEYFVTIELTGDISMHRRGYRIYDHPAALKPTLAYALLRLSDAKDGETIMDPMCGGGTVAVEAAMLFEDAGIICIDKNPRHVRGAMLNAAAARVYPRIKFIVGDARRLEKLVGMVDRVASNPPYGIRMGSPSEVRRLYRGFLESLSKVLRIGGKASIITTEAEHIRRKILPSIKLAEEHSRRVQHGDLWAEIMVLKREA